MNPIPDESFSDVFLKGRLEEYKCNASTEIETLSELAINLKRNGIDAAAEYVQGHGTSMIMKIMGINK
ncbi:MAG TPA: hypothetical protein VE244_07045 [Nitrososphaeraceae archaeon]|nr:hypothetical protein [Nitrososphaeraceae archaeon]